MASTELASNIFTRSKKPFAPVAVTCNLVGQNSDLFTMMITSITIIKKFADFFYFTEIIKI